MHPRRVVLLQGGLGLGCLAAWEVAGRALPGLAFVLGTPLAVSSSLLQLLLHENLLMHFVVTGAEAAVGLTLGTVLGSCGGLALWYFRSTARVAHPFIIASGSVPILAFAPLMIVWFGVGFRMKVAMATFATVFVALNQAYRGAASVSTELLTVLRGLNATERQLFQKVVVPGSMDWVLNSMRLNGGLSLLGAFIGEFIASDRGLGWLIIRASGLYNVPRALAAAACVSVLALAFDWGARCVEQRRGTLIQALSVPRALWVARTLDER